MQFVVQAAHPFAAESIPFLSNAPVSLNRRPLLPNGFLYIRLLLVSQDGLFLFVTVFSIRMTFRFVPRMVLGRYKKMGCKVVRTHLRIFHFPCLLSGQETMDVVLLKASLYYSITFGKTWL